MKNKLQIYACLIVLILSMSFTVPAFSQNINIKKTLPDGESSLLHITGITQDVKGVMWFSTKKGLYKYDSNSFESYKNNPLDPSSITSNMLETIFADSTGIIWIGSLGYGLARFDPATEKFTQYQHNPKDESSLSNDTVTAILRDSNGNLWIGTHGGLDLFEPETNSFIHYRHDPDNPNSLSNNQIRVLYEDSKNTLWIGAGSPYPDNGGGPDSGGLNRMNKNSSAFTRFMHNPNDSESLLSNKISAIYEDNNGNIWIGTAKYGLHKMNGKEGTFERLVYNPGEPDRFSAPQHSEQSLVYEHITFVAQDVKDNFWFGTVASGLYYFNPDSGKVVKCRGSENSVSGFDDSGAWTTYTSRDGIFWIGGTDGGIYFTNPLHKNIPHFNFDDKHAESFFEESDGTFWIGSDDEVYRYTGIDKAPQKYVIVTDAINPDTTFISDIYEDKKKNIWVGSPGGLSLWDNINENFIHYTHDPEDNRTISDNAVQVIYEDQKENLWIVTANGLNLFDRETGLATRYYPAGPERRNLVTSVTEDHTGKLWTGVWNGHGVNLLNPEKNEFKTYLNGSSIISVYEDTKNILWAAGQDGLYRFDRENDVFINTRHLHHMLDVGFTFSMVEDDQSNLWLSTSSGIVKINSQRNEISIYGENYGVDGDSFVHLSSYKSRDGKIYFGNRNGYYAFYPGEFINDFNAPDIVFTGFNLRNRLVKEGDEGLLQGQLSNLNEIDLKYDQNVFSFDIMQIDYAYPEKNKMFCYLENYDNDWRHIISNQRAHYFNVPPGEYIFRVKAVNGYGIWAEKQVTLTIMPPWWKSWWAYVFYFLVFCLGVFLVHTFMRNRVISKEKQKAQLKELEHAREIEIAYTELKSTQAQLIHSEKMASLGELTAGIAHEIQNPLNFVNNFSEVNSEILEELEQERKKKIRDFKVEDELIKGLKENEQKIYYHGSRADAIVKGMLQHSRSSNGNKEPTDINNLCDEFLRLSYHGLRAKDKSFNADFKTDFDPNLPRVNVVPQDIGRVLLNLINNAFYAVSSKASTLKNSAYKPEVIVSTQKLSDAVELTVRDNGPGIPSEIKDFIFHPFFTTKPTGQGTGLGLSIVYDIVKAHGGEIKVETDKRTGSMFIVTLKHKD